MLKTIAWLPMITTRKSPKRIVEYNIQNNVRNFTSDAVRRNSVWYGAVDCGGI